MELLAQSDLPQYQTNKNAMYKRQVIATIGADRAAKLSHELTRHQVRQQ